MRVTAEKKQETRQRIVECARNLFNDLFERKPLSVVIQFFQEFFAFLLTLMTQTTLRNTTILLRKFSKRQLVLLQ